MFRYLLLLTSCALLADPTWGTFPIPNLLPAAEPSLLGKLLASRAKARAQGKPLLPVMPLLAPPKLPRLTWDYDEEEENNQGRNSKGPERDFSKLEPLENSEDSIKNNQVDDDENLGSQRKNKPSANSSTDKFLNPGKHSPDGYPSRSDSKDDKSPDVFPSNPSDQARNVHRVLDSPLPNPGEGPSYTVFVRANDPNVGPTVHIVKHSVQTIMPVEAKNSASEILGMNMWRVPESLRNFEVNGKRLVLPGENPEEVLGAARRDLLYRTGSLYGVPTRGGYGLGGYGSEHGGLGYGGLGHGGLGHGGYGSGSYAGLGYGGLGYGGGIGQSGLGYGAISHAGLSHGGLGYGGLGHGGLGYGGVGHGGFGHAGYGHGGFAHGGYEEDAFGHGAHALDSFGHSSVGHTTFSESTHGESLHGENAYGVGEHGHNNFGAYGQGEYGVGHGSFGHYGLRAADTPKQEKKEEPVLGTGLPPAMLQPYMGLLDMSGERKYKHVGSTPEYTKKHCFPPYCPVHQAHKSYQTPVAHQSYQPPQAYHAYQTYNAPQAPQTYHATQTQQTYQTQQAHQNYQTPQTYQAPQAHQSYQAPQSYHAPQAQQSYQAPQAHQTYQAPQAQQTYQAPQVHQTYQAPQAQQSYQAPQASQTYQASQHSYEAPSVHYAPRPAGY